MAYVSKAKTIEISGTSRSSVKVRDNFYTIEASAKKSIPSEIDGVDMDREWSILFDELNDVVDAQIEETVKAVLKRK